MPSEVIIPGFVVIAVLLVVSIYAVTVLTGTISALADALRAHSENMAKLYNKVEIVDARVNAYDNSTGVLDLTLLVKNIGEDPVYLMDKCDLIVEYSTAGSGVVVRRLTYGAEWFVEYVSIAGNYSVPFSERRLIGGGEVGVIRAVFTAGSIDLNKPFKVIFVSHYGTKGSRWVLYSA